MSAPHLGVNVDHVATLREARRGRSPDPLEAAREAVAGGAEAIVVHLREDRRHIREADVRAIRKSLGVPLDLEMSAEPEIVKFAQRMRPAWCCLVPERREELTTEGGLNLRRSPGRLRRAAAALRRAGIRVSFFIEPRPEDLRLARTLGADAVELHTGAYANATPGRRGRALKDLREAVRLGGSLGLLVNAGHGLDYGNVRAVAALPGLHALNIGFSIVSRAVFVGMREAVREMKRRMERH